MRIPSHWSHAQQGRAAAFKAATLDHDARQVAWALNNLTPAKDWRGHSKRQLMEKFAADDDGVLASIGADQLREILTRSS